MKEDAENFTEHHPKTGSTNTDPGNEVRWQSPVATTAYGKEYDYDPRESGTSGADQKKDANIEYNWKINY